MQALPPCLGSLSPYCLVGWRGAHPSHACTQSVLRIVGEGRCGQGGQAGALCRDWGYTPRCQDPVLRCRTGFLMSGDLLKGPQGNHQNPLQVLTLMGALLRP